MKNLTINAFLLIFSFSLVNYCYGQSSITIDKKIEVKLFSTEYELQSIEGIIQQSFQNEIISYLLGKSMQGYYGNFDIRNLTNKIRYSYVRNNQIYFKSTYYIVDLLRQKIFDDCNALLERETVLMFSNEGLVLNVDCLNSIFVDYSDLCLTKRYKKNSLVSDINKNINCTTETRNLSQLLNNNFLKLSEPLSNISDYNNEFVEFKLESYRIDKIEVKSNNIVLSVSYSIALM